MAGGRKQFNKRGSDFGRNTKQGARKNAHATGTKPMLMEESELPSLLEKTKEPLILILDCIQDPHNLGACLRSANGAGVTAVIMPKDRAVAVTQTAMSVSCGGATHTPIFRVTNLARTIETLKDQGIRIAGTSDHKGTENLYTADLSGPLALVMGSEAKGMRELTMKKCDLLLEIPMAGFVECLNVSVATGVCLFEITRRR